MRECPTGLDEFVVKYSRFLARIISLPATAAREFFSARLVGADVESKPRKRHSNRGN